MSLWGRITRAFRRRRAPSPPTPPPAPPRGPGYDRDPDLPPNWDIVGLWNLGSGRRDVDNNVSDSEIISADQIIVRHVNPDNGVVSHRTIHGAVSKRQIGQLIIYNIANPAGSPPGSRSEDK